MDRDEVSEMASFMKHDERSENRTGVGSAEAICEADGSRANATGGGRNPSLALRALLGGWNAYFAGCGRPGCQTLTTFVIDDRFACCGMFAERQEPPG